jgi:hypothetical protein
MDELQTSDELTFLPESVEPICFDAIEAVLKDKTYSDMLVQGWIDEICSRITKELIETNKPFKYAGTMAPISLDQIRMILQYDARKFYVDFCFYCSHMHDNAEEWSWIARRLFMLLG